MRQHPIIGLYADGQTSFARTYPHPIHLPSSRQRGERWALLCAIAFAVAAVTVALFSKG